MNEQNYDVVKNPSHYCAGRQYEPRKVIEDWGLDFYLGNALKYISRIGRKKNAIEDLQKAIQYIKFEIEKLDEKTEIAEVPDTDIAKLEKKINDLKKQLNRIYGISREKHDSL